MSNDNISNDWLKQNISTLKDSSKQAIVVFIGIATGAAMAISLLGCLTFSTLGELLLYVLIATIPIFSLLFVWYFISLKVENKYLWILLSMEFLTYILAIFYIWYNNIIIIKKDTTFFIIYFIFIQSILVLGVTLYFIRGKVK